MSLRIEVVESTTRLMQIEHDWRALAMRSGAGVFQSHTWISTWWRCVSERPGLKLRVAVAWSGGDLVGVLPFAIHRRKLLRTLRWASEVFSDYCDALIDPRLEIRTLLEALWGAVADAGGFDLASLRQIRPDARAAFLFDQLSDRYCQPELEQGARCLQVRRRWPDGNGFFRSLGKKGRNNHQRGKRILAEQTGGEVRFCTYAPGEDQRAVLDRLMALKRDWLRATDQASPLLGAEGPVLRALLDAMAEVGALTVFTIESGGHLAAASANFVGDDTNRAYVTAYDPAFGRASAGTMLIVEYTMWSFDRGLSEVDFLRGEEAFKLGMANAETVLSGILAPCSLAGTVALAVRSARERARGMAPALQTRLWRGGDAPAPPRQEMAAVLSEGD